MLKRLTKRTYETLNLNGVDITADTLIVDEVFKLCSVEGMKVKMMTLTCDGDEMCARIDAGECFKLDEYRIFDLPLVQLLSDAAPLLDKIQIFTEPKTVSWSLDGEFMGVFDTAFDLIVDVYFKRNTYS